MSDSKFWVGKLQIPPISESIFLDIETSIYDERVWMIGCLYDKKFVQFTAKNWDEEASILDQFADYLAKYPGIPVVCYSKTYFDFRYIWNRARHYKNRPLLLHLRNRAWIDLAIMLGRVFRAPFSKSLKFLGDLYGYPFAIEGMDGLEISSRYHSHVKRNGSIGEEFLKTAEAYNIDDLQLLPFLIEKWGNNVEFINSFTCNQEEQELYSIIKQDVLDFNKTQTYYRISCETSKIDNLARNICKLGIPYPVIHLGVNRSRLIWSSKLGKERISQLFYHLT